MPNAALERVLQARERERAREQLLAAAHAAADALSKEDHELFVAERLAKIEAEVGDHAVAAPTVAPVKIGATPPSAGQTRPPNNPGPPRLGPPVPRPVPPPPPRGLFPSDQTRKPFENMITRELIVHVLNGGRAMTTGGIHKAIEAIRPDAKYATVATEIARMREVGLLVSRGKTTGNNDLWGIASQGGAPPVQ